MAVLCHEFDIARKTGYKIFNRYQDCGLRGLTDRSRRPYRQANQLPFQIEKRVVQLKHEHEHPNWVVPSTRSGHAGSRLPRNGKGPLNLLFLAPQLRSDPELITRPAAPRHARGTRSRPLRHHTRGREIRAPTTAQPHSLPPAQPPHAPSTSASVTRSTAPRSLPRRQHASKLRTPAAPLDRIGRLDFLSLRSSIACV